MKLNVFILISFFLYAAVGNSQKRKTYFDGPYIDEDGKNYKISWVEEGKPQYKTVSKKDKFIFSRPNLPIVDLSQLKINKEKFKKYKDVQKFVALSDIHGQHDLFISLLQSHGVIDDNEKWIYGDGHLVIVGDIMDRGDKVTETLWFLIGLEKEAELTGGKVHTLLGNHELMVMHDKIGYIHLKYRYTMGATTRSYSDFFNDKSILGQWLRSKNIITVINDFGFVHGGFSPAVLAQEHSISKINKIFKKNLIPDPSSADNPEDFKSLLYFEHGPLWYRGYANPEAFDQTTADSILNVLDLESLVVGHTSMPNVMSLHDYRFILVDSSIKFGETGELLIYENDKLYRGLADGEKILLENSVDLPIEE